MLLVRTACILKVKPFHKFRAATAQARPPFEFNQKVKEDKICPPTQKFGHEYNVPLNETTL